MFKKELLAGWELLKAKVFRKRTPLLIGWSLTNRCNWRCLYCGRPGRNKEELLFSQICRVIDELSSLGTYSINFTGGEPLLRDDIGKIIEYAKSKTIRIEISSNGSLVPQKIEEIKNVDILSLSFDGPPEIHNKQRQEGGYEQIISAIFAAKDKNIPLKLQTVLTVHNIDKISSVLDFAEQFNVPVSFQSVRFTHYSDKDSINSLLPSPDKYRVAICDILKQKNKKRIFIRMSKVSSDYIMYVNENKGRISCCAGIIYCRIEPNGDVYPCSDLMSKITPLNCVREGFKKAFFDMGFKTEHCSSRCCNNRIEMNSIYSLIPEAIINFKKNLRLK